MQAPVSLDAACRGQVQEQVEAVGTGGRFPELAEPVAALIFDFAADVAMDGMLGADGEGGTGLAAVAVEDGVGA